MSARERLKAILIETMLGKPLRGRTFEEVTGKSVDWLLSDGLPLVLEAAGAVAVGRAWPWPVEQGISEERVKDIEAERDRLKAANQKAIELLDKWLADESGYDEQTYPILKAALEEKP